MHGWGLYFAKERSVSEGYKKRLSTKRTIIHLGENSYVEYGSGYKEISSGERVDGSSALGFALDGILAGEGDISSVIQTFENDIKESDAENSAFYKEIVRILRENDSSVEEDVDTSRLFDVEIPDNDVLLDEQKPFNQQPKFVQEKLKELFGSSENAAELQTMRHGYDIYRQLSKRLGGDKAASLALNEVGIKGITYDGHRDGRCFVVFDDKEKRGQVSLTPENITDVYDVVKDFDEATLEQSDVAGNQKIMVVKDVIGRMFALFVERGKNKAEIKTVYKYKKTSPMSDAISPNLNARSDSAKVEKRSPMSDVTSPEPNVRNDSAKVSFILNISLNEAEDKQEPTLEEFFQLTPALKKAALEYGARDENGKVTFPDEARNQEFIKVAKTLLGAGERKTSAPRQESLREMLDNIKLVPLP